MKIDHIDIKTTPEKKAKFRKICKDEGKTMTGEIKRLIHKEHNINL